MDEKRTSDKGMGKEDESSEQARKPGSSDQPGQGGQGGSTQQPGQGGQGGQGDPGIQPGKGESQANDWNKEPAKGTDDTES